MRNNKSAVDGEKRAKLAIKMNTLAAKDILVAFSGGVDSAVVLKLAVDAAEARGTNVYAVTFDLPMTTGEDTAFAEASARAIGGIHQIVKIDMIDAADIRDNPPNRCYRCKRYLFSGLAEMAESYGVTTILDGTNADDMAAHRPGKAALSELGVVSPLALAGLTKAEVRAMAAEMGLDAHDKPSAPCLATRFPYGTRLTRERLDRVARAEAALKAMGFSTLRVRVHDALVRLEVPTSDFDKVMAEREAISSAMHGLGYAKVTLDLDGFRSGSFDEGPRHLKAKQ